MKSIIYSLPQGKTESQLPLDLIQAYYNAHFCVFAETEFILRIGIAQPNLSPEHCYGYVTACNPEGKILPDESNQINHKKLIDWARLNDLRFKEGAGRDPKSIWHEEISLLIEDLSLAETIRLGRHFNQNAVVWCDKDQIPRLVILQ